MDLNLLAQDWEDLSWGQTQPLESYVPTPAPTRVQPPVPTQSARPRVPSIPNLPKPPSRSRICGQLLEHQARPWGQPPDPTHKSAQRPEPARTPVGNAYTSPPMRGAVQPSNCPGIVQPSSRPQWGAPPAPTQVMLPPPRPSQRRHRSSSGPSSDRTLYPAQTPRAVRRMKVENDGVGDREAGPSRLRPSSPSNAIEVAALTQRPWGVQPGQGLKGAIAQTRRHWGHTGWK